MNKHYFTFIGYRTNSEDSLRGGMMGRSNGAFFMDHVDNGSE